MVALGKRLVSGMLPNPRGTAAKSSHAVPKLPSGRIWPNGEFGLSWHKKDVELSPVAVSRGGGVSVEHIRSQAAKWDWGKFNGLPCGWSFSPSPLRPQQIAEQYSPLWLVKSLKSAQRPKTYGRKGITGYGGKVVRNGAHLLEDKYGKGRLAFLTLTLPDWCHEDQCILAEGWSYLIKTLVQGLRRLLAKAGLPTAVVLVTELQPKRMENGSSGCLHIHAVFVGRHARSRWAYSPFVYKSLWLRLCSNLLDKPVDCVPCENVQPVRKSASNYLSKYMSKGSEDVEKFAELVGWERVPRQWWTATKNIKNAVKKFTISGEEMSKILDQIVHNYWKSGGVPNTMGVVFSRPITLEATEYQDIVIGYFGKLTRETYLDLLEMRDCAKTA